jgi:GT2 family glycosyltransferase
MLSTAHVSIVIVTWNGRALLERCLPSVVAHSGDAEVVVVDNGSDDGTVAWLAAAYPQVQVIVLPENRGFCGGNNAGAEAASGDVLVFLNNDVEVTPGWLDPLLAHLDAHPACAAVQPKLLRHDVRTQFEYAGAAGGYLDRLGYPFARGRLFFTLEDDTGQYDAPRRVFWATGAALAVRRTALGGAPPFDERFFMHMEEIDLCWRLQRAGHEVWCMPQSVAYHIGGASLPQGHPRKAYYNFRNNLLLLYRHLPPRLWRRVFPARVALDGLAIARAVAGGNVREAAAIFRAYADAHRMKGAFAQDRPGNDVVLPPYRRSLVADYFLRGRRRFQDLPADAFRAAFRA